MPIFRVKSVKIYTGQKKFTRAPLVVLVTNMRYAQIQTQMHNCYENDLVKGSKAKDIRLTDLQPQYALQGGRTWQSFVGGKNGHENFRQTRTYNFRNKCVVFARNLKFSNLTQ